MSEQKPVRTLSREDARRVYDRIGSLQDSQAFYEDRATDLLVQHGDFSSAKSVFEFGCGTGRFAARLLAEELPEDARYRAIDISPTMIGLAEARIAPFAPRASVVLSEGGPPVDEPAGGYDRFYSSFVFDLLSEDDIAAVLAAAHRMLEPGGLLCLSSLSTGSGAASRFAARLWSAVHRLRPSLVGGCRPLDLTDHLSTTRWKIRHHQRLTPFGVPSEVVVAERL
jgi:ubiquinone/menaquinone biosynthesis C-methylase UbiE